MVALLSRDRPIFRHAARVAAGRVRSDREHAEALVAHYQAVIDAKRYGAMAAG
ncbi:hypothetical protein AB5I41_18290 [Sphingomonas sp. MMS24-JH45]